MSTLSWQGEKNRLILDLAALATILYCAAVILIEKPWLLCIPILCCVGIFLLKNPAFSYYAFFLLMPFSVEVELPGGLSTDLPTEPLMWVTLIYSTILVLSNLDRLNTSRLQNPITLMILLHLIWIGICTVMSGYKMISFKWLVAKFWYVIPFYCGTYYFVSNQSNFTKVLKLTFWTLMIAVMIVLARHGMKGFAFDEINKSVWPIFRNHVNYAATLVLFLPFIFYLFCQERRPIRYIYSMSIVILVLAIYLSYTRAAILCLGIGFVAYFIIKVRMLAPTLVMVIMVAVAAISFLISDNNFVHYAPDYDKTISHDNFQNLIDATYKLEDISTMERVHRWVAGGRMIADKPIFGFGPGTFYSSYEPYTVNIFKTYVSDNPEQSGIHSYYLMTAVEQGLVGFIILIGLVIFALLYGQSLYHNLSAKQDKSVIMACMISIICTLSINIINDMFEVDKVGPYFFFSLAIFGVYGHRLKSNP
jgi:O-antigen ligase